MPLWSLREVLFLYDQYIKPSSETPIAWDKFSTDWKQDSRITALLANVTIDFDPEQTESLTQREKMILRFFVWEELFLHFWAPGPTETCGQV